MQVHLQQVDAQVKVTLASFSTLSGPCWSGLQTFPSSCPSPLLSHTLSLSQVSSPGVDFGPLTVKQAASGGSPGFLSGAGRSEGVSREGQILEWGGAALADLGV